MQKEHRRHPGRLFKKVSNSVSRFLEKSHTSTASMSVLEPKFTRYFNLVLSRKLERLRNKREALTLALIMDCILKDRTLSALDLLAQRLLALEAADGQGSWAVAQHIELIPPDSGTAISSSTLRTAGKSELSALRLRETLEKARTQGSSG